MTTTRVLAKRTFAHTREGFYGMALFLTNELDGFTGPGWTLVEADDGTNRNVPTGSANFAGLPVGNAWISGSGGTPPSGSWCMLESIDANNTNHFQLFIRMNNDNEAQFRLIHFEDFTTVQARSGDNDPTFPTTGSIGLGDPAANVTLTGYSVASSYSCIADEGMVSFIVDNGITPLWMYAGEVLPFHSGAGDTRAYTIYDKPTQVYFDDVGSSVDENWNRVSPLDDVTTLVRGEPLHVGNSATTVRFGGDRGNLLGSDVVWPVGVVFQDSGHFHHQGWLRNVFTVNNALGTEGTLGVDGTPSFYFRSSSTTNARGGVCWVWDGSTIV